MEDYRLVSFVNVGEENNFDSYLQNFERVRLWTKFKNKFEIVISLNQSLSFNLNLNTINDIRYINMITLQGEFRIFLDIFLILVPLFSQNNVINIQTLDSTRIKSSLDSLLNKQNSISIEYHLKSYDFRNYISNIKWDSVKSQIHYY